MSMPNRTNQQGVVLFISLILLLVLTILGVSTVQTTSLEVRMSRNHHDSTLAFQAAESALRDAEDAIEAVLTTAVFDDAGPLYAVAEMDEVERWRVVNVWTGGNSAVAATNVDGVAEQPRYIIEHAASVIREENAYQLDDPYAAAGVDRIEMFRITARGIGGTPNARVVLQSGYGRILD